MSLKIWTKPEISTLDIAETASGGDPSTAEANGYFSGGWHNATYNATTTEKCEGHGTVIPKKETVES